MFSCSARPALLRPMAVLAAATGLLLLTPLTASATATPPAASADSPTAGQSPALPYVPNAALLTASDVDATAIGQGHTIRAALYHPCGARYAVRTERVAAAYRRFEDQMDGQPIEGRYIADDAVRYSSPANAARAVAQYRQATVDCPREVHGTTSTTYEVLQKAPLIVRELSVDSAFPSAPPAPLYWMFPRVGDLVSTVEAGHSEGDIGLAEARSFAEKARRHMVSVQ